MNTSLKKITLATVVLFIFSTLKAQSAGEIFTKEKADELFGEVKEMVEVKLETARGFISGADDYILFRIVDSSLVVINSAREVIFNEKNIIFSETDVFYMYNRFVYEELIYRYTDAGAGADDLVFFEKREEVFSVTAGVNTMEKAVECPPWCGKYLQISEL